MATAKMCQAENKKTGLIQPGKPKIAKKTEYSRGKSICRNFKIPGINREWLALTGDEIAFGASPETKTFHEE